MEAAGIEPASLSRSVEASTHVVNLLCLAGQPPVDGMHPGQPVISGFAGFPAGDVAALRAGTPAFLSPYADPQVGAAQAGLLFRQPSRMPVCVRHVRFCQVFNEAA